ncbi:hypothetical protein ACE1CD_12905 [Aerosakkonema sp. BLCC-F183]|uniref:hypothetical protein n=1 Tax=Aerosakkonema sp. BLCC-F183 TaxID=3342834 RepID=UPI0035B81C6B
MSVRLHPHAQTRLLERGATEEEVIATVESGTPFAAQFGRSGFRRNFPFNAEWQGKVYAMKKVEAIAIKENEDWLVITVIAKLF